MTGLSLCIKPTSDSFGNGQGNQYAGLYQEKENSKNIEDLFSVTNESGFLRDDLFEDFYAMEEQTSFKTIITDLIKSIFKKDTNDQSYKGYKKTGFFLLNAA